MLKTLKVVFIIKYDDGDKTRDILWHVNRSLKQLNQSLELNEIAATVELVEKSIKS